VTAGFNDALDKIPAMLKSEWLLLACSIEAARVAIDEMPKGEQRTKLKQARRAAIDRLVQEMLVEHDLPGEFEWLAEGWRLEFDPAGKTGDGSWDTKNEERVEVRVTRLK
jgi:hypothetical protein